MTKRTKLGTQLPHIRMYTLKYTEIHTIGNGKHILAEKIETLHNSTQNGERLAKYTN